MCLEILHAIHFCLFRTTTHEESEGRGHGNCSHCFLPTVMREIFEMDEGLIDSGNSRCYRA